MPTKITDTNTPDGLQGSPEKRFDIAPNGTMWTLVVARGAPGSAKFFRSTNGGASWVYASSSDVNLGQASAVPSFFLDADGYAHVSWARWDTDPQVIRYARGKPTSGGGWSWTYLTISPAGGRTGVETDVIAFRSGTGWVAWVSWSLRSGSGGAKVSRVAITSTGTLSVTTTQHGPSGGEVSNQFGSLEWNHNGDGKTRVGSPHLYLVRASQGSASPLRVNRAQFAAGDWTWGSSVVANAAAQVEQTALASIWDGSRLMVAYSANNSTVNVFEWDGDAASVTARNPPAAPGGTGTVLGLSMSHDPDTDDIYLTYYDVTDGDIRFSKFSRTTLTWTAWLVAISRTATNYDGKLQMVRHSTRDSIDIVYGIGTGNSWQIYASQLAALVRAPDPPTLSSPASGARLDLAAGATFTWQYNPVSLGDSQQAWAFRRTYSSTTEYWNATSQTWSGSIVWNTTVPANPTTATFAPGQWANGTTYTWSVRTRSSTGSDSTFATDRTVVATTAPVIDVTSPLGIVYGESTPLITWDYTSLDAQANYQVRVIEEQAGIDPDVTTPVWDSGVVNGSIARSARVVTSLSDGIAYRAYVRATSATAIASAWDYSTFMIEVTPPGGPLVEVIDEVHWDTGVPRIRLDVIARSNFLSTAQDSGGTGWDVDANVTLAAQAADTGAQILDGFRMTSVAAGLIGAVTEPGSPPAAPYGQPQPDGPLSFPVVPGVPYTALASFRAVGTTRAARVSIRWYDADDGTGVLISTSVGLQVPATDVSYSQAYVTDVAPVGAVLARMVVEVLGATAGSEQFYVAQPAFAPGRSTVWAPGGYSTTQTLRVQRSTDGGLTWETVEERLKPSLDQMATTYDRLMPLGVDVQYRAYTEADLNGSTLASSASPVSTGLVEPDVWAVRDPAEDLAEMNAYVVGFERSDDESSSVSWPAGRAVPVIDTEGRHAPNGYLDIFVQQDQIDVAVDVLRRTVPMVVQSPNGKVYVVRLLRREYKVEQLRHRVVRVAYQDVVDL